MNKAFLLISLFFLLFYGCQDKKILVPEISPNISHELVYSIENSDKLLRLIKNNKDMFLIFKDGKIIQIDPNTFQKKSQYQFKSELGLEIKAFKNIIVFSDVDKNIFLFDLNKMNVIFSEEKDQFKKIKYVDENIIIYNSLKKLIFFDYIKKIKLGELIVKTEDIQDCFVYKNKILICTKKKLFEFNMINKNIDFYKLKIASNSKYLLYNGILYYCSDHRKLIKFSLNKKKVLWSIKLPAFSEIRPIKVGNNIAVILKDYNIYIYNKNGSLSWWDKLGTTPFSSPLIMTENIAIPLRPKKKPSIKFFNIKEKKSVLYKMDIPISAIFFNQNSILGLSDDKIDNKLNIIKIGNIYKLDVKILPETVLVVDKSIEFKLKPVNLIKPSYKIMILDSDKKNIYSTDIFADKPPSFIWFPKTEGDFELVIETDSENRDKILTNKPFSIIDLKKLQYKYYHRILSNCINRK